MPRLDRSQNAGSPDWISVLGQSTHAESAGSMDRLRELKVGQTETLSRRIAAEDVDAFARLSGDYNALHVDEEFAARTEFAQRVVHGFLHASLLSTLVGTKLPGRGALYVSQTIQFSRPVFIGDTVEARATIEKIDEEIVGTILKKYSSKDDFRLVVLPDHPTPVEKRCHVDDPVCFVMFGKGIAADGSIEYNEPAAKLRGLKFKSGEELVDYFIRKDLD